METPFPLLKICRNAWERRTGTHRIGVPIVKKKESRAVARKPRDVAGVLFRLKFADNIHYKFESSQASPGFRAPNIPAQNRI